MPVNLSDKTVCVVDNGLFCELARTLGKSFKHVFYTTDWQCAFPLMQQGRLGEGIPEIEVVDSPFRHFDETDLFVFPDVNHGPMQNHIASQGKRVWGSRSGEDLELDRVATKQMMEGLDLPVGPYSEIRGMSALREHIKKHRNCWVKLSKYRGHFESFQAKSYSLIEPRLDEIQHQLGPLAEHTDFIVESNLPNKFECAVDAYCIDGQFPSQCLVGVEIKDLGYCGAVLDYAKIPEPITRYDQAIVPYLKEVKYRNFYSAECRIGEDKVPYMVDHCARMASPPGELYQKLYKNIAEIIWEGADGNLVEPQCAGKFGVEILLHSTWSDKNWQPIDFPDAYRESIQLRNPIRVGGKWYVIPQNCGLSEVGSCIGIGASLEEACEQAKEIASSVKGYYIDVPDGSLEDAQEELQNAKEMGLKIA